MTKFLHLNTNDQTRDLPKGQRKLLQGRTVAVEPLEASYIKQLALDFLSTSEDVLATLNVGITFCSLSDNYVKQEGRNKSLEKQTNTAIKVAGVVSNETHLFVHLAPYKGTSLTLRVNKNTGFATVLGSIGGGRNS